MTRPTHPSSRRKGRRWVPIIIAAAIVHLVLLFGLRPGFFDVFRKSLVDSPPSSSSAPSYPNAIVAVPIEIDGDEPSVVPPDPNPVPVRKPTTSDGRVHEVDATDVLDIVGQTQTPLSGNATSARSRVPPRPVEITWPRTKGLRHCLGLHIEVQIHVSTTGAATEVRPSPNTFPADCVAAALGAARRIRFAPGSVDGTPTAMWTRVRIDFRSER